MLTSDSNKDMFFLSYADNFCVFKLNGLNDDVGHRGGRTRRGSENDYNEEVPWIHVLQQTTLGTHSTTEGS